MINLITKSITKLFGTKSERDIRELSPYVDKVNAEFAKLQALSNDELRAVTTELKKAIGDRLQDIDTKLAGLHQQIVDVFDAHGVRLTSPHFLHVATRAGWTAPPAGAGKE